MVAPNDLNPAGVDAAALKQFGYAPGNYSCQCVTCGRLFIGDKRAIACEACATKMAEEAATSTASLLQPEGETATCKEGLQVQSEETAELVERAKRLMLDNGCPPIFGEFADAITSLSQRLAVAEARATAAYNDGYSDRDAVVDACRKRADAADAQLAHAREAAIEECAAVVRSHRPDASFDDSSAGYMERHALLKNVEDEIRALSGKPTR